MSKADFLENNQASEASESVSLMPPRHKMFELLWYMERQGSVFCGRIMFIYLLHTAPHRGQGHTTTCCANFLQFGKYEICLDFISN